MGPALRYEILVEDKEWQTHSKLMISDSEKLFKLMKIKWLWDREL